MVFKPCKDCTNNAPCNTHGTNQIVNDEHDQESLILDELWTGAKSL